MLFPADRKYFHEHTWVQAAGDVATIGITDHAQDELGEIVYLDLPEPGTRVEQGAKMGEIESVKTVSDLISPVSGEVLEQNRGAQSKPEVVNTAPFGDGWLVKIRMSDPAQVESLLSAADYRAQVEAGH